MHEVYIIDCSRSWVSVLLDFLLSFKEETFKYCKYDVAFLALVVAVVFILLSFFKFCYDSWNNIFKIQFGGYIAYCAIYKVLRKATKH